MTTPHMPGGPDGAYVLGGMSGSDDWNASSIRNVTKAPVLSSFTQAQNAHRNNVIGPIAGNTTQIGASSLGLTDHENRIWMLENGDQISVFYSDDTWLKPPSYNYHTVHAIGGSGGGQGGEGGLPAARGGQGGGQGGYQVTTFTDAELPGASYSVDIGVGGQGDLASYVDDFERPNAINLGSNWRTDSGGATHQLKNGAAEAGPAASGEGPSGRWDTFIPETSGDNVRVIAQAVPPSTSAVSDMTFFGVYVAAPTTYSGSTKLIAFVGVIGNDDVPNGACGLISQVNQVSAPYNPTGAQSGQTILADTADVGFKADSVIALERYGNVFTGYIDGVVALQWTDTGNTVPTGPGHRHFGIITSARYESVEAHSPAFSGVQVMELNAFPGTATTFTGDSASVTAGGGAAGSVRGSATPAARGTGNQTTLNAGGGVGGTLGAAGSAGGAGVDLSGGAGGAADGGPGSDGLNLATGKRGPGSGAGGGGGVSTSSGKGGLGGDGGFPGAGGGGGGGAPGMHNEGGGGNGTQGALWVVSSINPPA